MLEADITKLNQQTPRRSLDGLEADVWEGVAAQESTKRATRVVMACQAVVIAVAVTGSIAAGSRAGGAAHQSAELGVFSLRADLAPSTLLAGDKS